MVIKIPDIVQFFITDFRSATLSVGIRRLPGNLGSGLLQRFGTVGEASSDNQGAFIQDSWTINNRLTLNLGLRMENEVVPSFGDSTTRKLLNLAGATNLLRDSVLHLTFYGDGKNKLFASYGWFYDRFKYELPRGSFGGDFFRRDYFEILPSRGTALYKLHSAEHSWRQHPDPIGGTVADHRSVTGYSACQFDFRIATNSVDANIFETGGVDPDIKAARQSEYTIGYERQLARNFIIECALYTQTDRPRD